MSHADRFANAGHLRSSEGDVAVTAFAVCIQSEILPLESKLDAFGAESNEPC